MLQSHPGGRGEAVVAVVWLECIVRRECEAGVAPALRKAKIDLLPGGHIVPAAAKRSAAVRAARDEDMRSGATAVMGL